MGHLDLLGGPYTFPHESVCDTGLCVYIYDMSADCELCL